MGKNHDLGFDIFVETADRFPWVIRRIVTYG